MINEELKQQIEQLEQQIKDLKVKLEKEVEKKPYEVEVPEDVDDCYTTGIYGIVDRLENFSTPYKEGCYKRGLIFKTREQAEQHDKELILLFKLHKWAEEHNGGWTPNWRDFDEYKYSVSCDCDEYKLFVKSCWYENAFSKLPYFKSEEIAEQFIEEFREEIIEVLC
ncbi:hypothetical protein [Gemella haemolysans]|uniref:Uncharacterized protein n=2 Tax=Gemella haemolysans TaxID=1379 RepID=A0AA87BBH5_9BACL|nr:hypothetical protein [Gemella haemolysans]EGF88473.1 hypothetical protein HMPREF0428_00991 [Gemella haemolysans M341]QIX88331.1 hypothetical protein FOC48_05930 [Gemella haemolysans]